MKYRVNGLFVFSEHHLQNVLIDPSIVNKVILYPTGIDRQDLMIILLFQHI